MILKMGSERIGIAANGDINIQGPATINQSKNINTFITNNYFEQTNTSDKLSYISESEGSWLQDNVLTPASKTRFGQYFNSVFGSNVTHIRNKSGKRIKVAVRDSETGIITEDELEPNGVGRYQRNNQVDLLSVWLINEDGSTEAGSQNFNIGANHSFWIDKSGGAKFRNYGEF